MKRFAIALGVVLAAAIWAAADPHAGVRTLWQLRAQLREAQARSAKLGEEVAALEAEADRLENDPLAVESAIRTDLGLAKPGETVVRAVPRPNP